MSGRSAESVFLLLAGLAWAAKVSVVAGAPAGLLGTVLVLAAGAASLAVSLPGPRPRWLDGPRLVLVLAGLLLFPTVYGKVGGDGHEYYAHARTLLFDRDLDFANDYAGLGAQPILSAQGDVTNRVPIGAALTWVPALVMTHAVLTAASWTGAAVRADGFTAPYQAAATTSTYVLALVALAALEAALRRRYGRTVALASTLGVWLASPLLYYTTANPSMSHGPQATAATLFVVLWLWARERPGDHPWLLTGLLGGLMSVVRVQDAVFLAMPLADLALRGRRGLRPIVLLLAGPVVLGALQALVWLRLYGWGFLGSVLAENEVAGGGLHVLDLLFSARHGLFTWTPAYLLAACGGLIFARREPRLGALFGLGLGLAVVVNAAMQDWWGMDSFGQRRLLGATPLFAFGLAAAIEGLRRRPMVLLGLGLGGLALWNLQLAGIFNSQALAPRNEALSLETLAGAQVDALYENLRPWERRVPGRVWFYLYENLKGIWLDEGPRSLGGVVDLGREPPDLPSVVGHNWEKPKEEHGVTYRRAVGQRAWLRIPVRTAGDFEAVLRARSEMGGEHELRAHLELNGNATEEAQLGAGWSEVRFRIPKESLRPGFNEVAVVFSTTPAAVVPGFRGKNVPAAVDWLRLTRLERPRGPF